jgi:hypothetical protein
VTALNFAADFLDHQQHPPSFYCGVGIPYYVIEQNNCELINGEVMNIPPLLKIFYHQQDH